MMGTAELAANVLLSMLMQAQQFQAKIAAGTITDADVDEALLQVGSSRAQLVADIAAAKAQGSLLP
jgi:chorismate mutase